MKPTHVLYHANCPDGFGAAFSVWKKYSDSVKYIACNYGNPPPVLPTEASVLIADFSFPKDVIIGMSQKVFEIQLLDHHKTAYDMLKDVPFCKFDMDHSGAYLTWEYIHGSEPPDFIKYIEDRDLWAFKLPYSKEFSAALGSYPKDFVVWEGLSEMGMDKLKLDGGTILRFQGQKVDEIIAQAFWKDIAGHRVPVVNASTFFSEVGDRLCQIHPTAPFSAYFYDRADGKRQWGLRSPGRMDVSKIAKSMGGGGHAGAAGFLEPVAVQRAESRSEL